MRRSGLVAHFGFDGKKVGRFFEEIERGQDDANPYHNSMHVSSVLHKMHTLLERTDLARRVAATLTPEGEAECAAEPLVKLACILAAGVHDYQHRGLSNDFLVRTLDDWALRYNDRQVSENHHIAAAFVGLPASPRPHDLDGSRDGPRGAWLHHDGLLRSGVGV
eukprot:CAMPEP_0176323260 /NCGR_PEP_ID=MMETSP0121_2-20121125/72295_1 /TAXON_ID=160619 /ORGANISM="Kryptoperidinium foliaceum, Strain CCMP 1326" /LENGTH=163 /DNA_ID=CAMNT_0017665773 /DNA_START=33 /DNA_END=521 /DNA_ORIENTATION=-